MDNNEKLGLTKEIKKQLSKQAPTILKSTGIWGPFGWFAHSEMVKKSPRSYLGPMIGWSMLYCLPLMLLISMPLELLLGRGISGVNVIITLWAWGVGGAKALKRCLFAIDGTGDAMREYLGSERFRKRETKSIALFFTIWGAVIALVLVVSLYG